MTERVRVVKDKGKYAVVEIKRTEKCAGCNKCAFNRKAYIRVNAIKDVECAAGDLVIVELPEKEILLAPLFLFVVPVACLLAGVALSRGLGVWAQLGVIAAALFISIGGAYLADRLYRRQRKYMPVVKEKIILQGEEQV